MKENNSDFHDTKFFDFDRFDNDDPYERGFADKLYEENGDDADFDVEDFAAEDFDEDDYGWDDDEDYEASEPQMPQRQPSRPRPINPYQQVYTPGKPTQYRREYPPAAPRTALRSRDEYDEQPRVRQHRPPESPRRANPVPRQEAAPQKPKRKHPILGFFLKLLLVLLLLTLAAALFLHFTAKPPMGKEALGAHSGDSATILLAGTDESGDRTDTIMLMNVNRADGAISLMSIPRDTKVNSTYTPHKINSAYGINGKDESGMDSLMDYVSDCIGFRPDGYILLELDVFVDLVDLLGGVDFDVPMDMYYEDIAQDLLIDLQQGMQSLSGEQAMGLVRYRYGYADADIGRVRVQRDFMLSAIDQWVSWKNVWKAPAAFTLLKSKATTDLSVRNLVWLAEAVLSCGTDDMYMTTVPFYYSDPYVIIDAGESYLNLINTYFNPYAENVTWDDLDIAY